MAGAAPVAAQEQDRLTVYLVTAEPGDAVWERFGHNGILISDTETGQDIFWEWGLFSFSQEGFIPRLARGEMLYAMGPRYLEDRLAVYRSQDRAVWAQELALTPEQERTLDRLVRTNYRPENRRYVYDYYEDNCSTRVRDVLDTVLGGQLRARFANSPSGVTWRWHTRRLLRDMPLAEAGVQIVLGNPGDERISRWQEMFLPMKVREYLSEAIVAGPAGPRPLVVSERVLLQSSRPAVPAEPASRVPLALLLGGVVAGIAVLLGRRGGAGSGAARRGLGALVLVWSLLAGLLGWLLVVAWVFTDHDFWWWNENVFQFDPLLVAGVILSVPLLRGRAPGPRLQRFLQVMAVVATAAVLLKLLPGLGQGNWGVLALTLPVHWGLLWGVREAAEARN